MRAMRDDLPDGMDHDIATPRLRRLTTQEFMAPRSSLQVYHHVLPSRVEVHWHEFYEVFLIIGGEGTHVLNGTTYPLVRGSAFLLTPADFHELVPREGSMLEVLDVIFADEVLQHEVHHLLFGELRDYAAVFEGAACDTIEAAFRRLWSESRERKPGYRQAMRGALEQVLIDLVRRCPTASRGDGLVLHAAATAQHPKIHKALVYLHHHFRDSLTLDQVAQQAQLSPHYFSECFHRATGLPFQSYVRELRLRFAQSLLQVTSMPVTDICFASGFATLPHFERAFKQQVGQSPRSYRYAGRAPEGAAPR